MTVDDALTLCAAAKLVVLSAALEGEFVRVTVAPLKVVPATAIKHLYDAGARFVLYSWEHGGEGFLLK